MPLNWAVMNSKEKFPEGAIFASFAACGAFFLVRVVITVRFCCTRLVRCCGVSVGGQFLAEEICHCDEPWGRGVFRKVSEAFALALVWGVR